MDTIENKFDHYLYQIREKQKFEHRRRWLKVSFVLAVFAGAFLLFQQLTKVTSEPTLRNYPHNDLSVAAVDELFAQDSTPILVSHPQIGWDTIRSMGDYQRFRELVSLIEIEESEESEEIQFISAGGDFAEDYEDKEETSPPVEAKEEKDQVSPFRVLMMGEMQADKEITFMVENYDPTVRYTLDFGNGVVRRIRKQASYTYPLSGSYLVRLIGTSRDRSPRVYARRIVVKAPSSEVLASRDVAEGGSKNPPLSPQDTELYMSRLNNATQWTVPRSSQENSAKEPEVKVVDMNKVRNQRIRELPAASMEAPLVYAEKMPSFPGGRDALRLYLQRRLTYPQEALNLQIQGQVIVQFVVQPDGTIANPKILKGLGGGCDEEAMRVVSLMPK